MYPPPGAFCLATKITCLAISAAPYHPRGCLGYPQYWQSVYGSALGPKQTYAVHQLMSALPSKAACLAVVSYPAATNYSRISARLPACLAFAFDSETRGRRIALLCPMLSCST